MRLSETTITVGRSQITARRRSELIFTGRRRNSYAEDLKDERLSLMHASQESGSRQEEVSQGHARW